MSKVGLAAEEEPPSGKGWTRGCGRALVLISFDPVHHLQLSTASPLQLPKSSAKEVNGLDQSK